MAEVVGSPGVTVIVLNSDETATLADLMLMHGDPVEHAELHELYDALGVPLGEPNYA